MPCCFATAIVFSGRVAADFYEDDVSTRMTAALSMIEPAIMIFMGIFVAFVLIALYLPIFSLADTFGG